jgi:Transglutaminase-like superfamily
MPFPTPTQRLRLADHVRACHSDGQVILLDLRRNKYLGLSGRSACALAEHIDGWPRGPQRVDDSASRAAVDALSRQLLSQGLLTLGVAQPSPPIRIDEARSSFDGDSLTLSASFVRRRLGRFLRSAAAASLRLRFSTLQAIARAVAEQRDSSRASARNSDPLQTLTRATAAYNRLRPLFFTTQDQCLHDSLALIGFLAGEGCFPNWVIGVKTRPFGAHSWVQSGATVLNDQHETVRKFRPILVV